MHLPTSPVRKWRGKEILRPPQEEDDNIRKASKLRNKMLGKRLSPAWFGRYVHRLVSTPNTRELDGLSTVRGEIEYRDFRWVLTSIFLPSDYHERPASETSQAPWRILMRCFFLDLPSQFQDTAEPIPWKRYPVGPLMPVSWVRISHKHLINRSSWGYRAVFSQEVRDKPRSLTGSWLVVVYIFANDRKWLSKADERTLITEQNLYKLNGHEQSKVWKDDWNHFWSWELAQTTRGSDRQRVTSDYKEADKICSLLERNAKRVLFGASFERSWPHVDGMNGTSDTKTAVL